MLPADLEPGEIDARVREITGRGEALYELDERALAQLEPDLIVTQALCAVCAVSYDDVRTVAARLDRAPTCSRSTQALERGPRRPGPAAERLRRPRRGVELRAGFGRGSGGWARGGGRGRPRVARARVARPAIRGGHWVPEMIELAGGTSVAGEPGRDSTSATWEELAAAEPDVVVVMPCGLYVDEAAEQALGRLDRIEQLGAERAGRGGRGGLVLATRAPAGRRRGAARPLLHPGRWSSAPRGLGWRELAAAAGRA